MVESSSLDVVGMVESSSLVVVVVVVGHLHC